ncbi:hypothetical protein NDU88_009609 [Pleurodeles waltl]|uniref:Uncharacterized protein n=1 Tax=Pleurodeles waltl TaxID=8319 RepID=A0AAV7PZW2_PLEWA|nr:hypothetical protein NDU88_009609 [Pleurodeles waltl]
MPPSSHSGQGRDFPDFSRGAVEAHLFCWSLSSPGLPPCKRSPAATRWQAQGPLRSWPSSCSHRLGSTRSAPPRLRQLVALIKGPPECRHQPRL